MLNMERRVHLKTLFNKTGVLIFEIFEEKWDVSGFFDEAVGPQVYC